MPLADFNLWKWRALYRRRLFFFCVLQVVLIFNWLTVRRIIHHDQSWTDNGDASTGYRKFFEDLPILFYVSHGLLLATVLFTTLGRNLVHESQGKRLCDWSAFSLVLALIFLLTPLNSIEDPIVGDSRNISFTTLSLLGVAIFQHLGISEPVLSITLYSIVILWIIFLSYVSLSPTSIVSICFVVLAFGLLSRMQEYEFHRAFTKQKDALHGTSYTGLNYGQEAIGVSSAMQLGAMNVGSVGHGNMSIFMEDTMMALKAMENAIAQQEDLLNREDLLMECEFKPLITNAETGNDDQAEDLAPVSASAVGHKEQEVVSWKLTSHAASLQINKLLCQSLYYAVANNEELSRVPGTSFSFNKICNQMFALFEGVRGNSLTLYANETVSEVLISAPKAMFELIIFLILHDAVHSDDRRICCLSCETSAAHGWHVSIQSILLEKHRDAHARGPNGLPLNDSNASTVSGSSGEGAAKTQQGAQSSILGPEGFGFGKGLMLNENVSNRNRPMERLAERITMKYLKSTIQHSDPEYRAGVRVEQKIIPLSSDRCMLAPTHDSLTFATAQSSAARPQQQPQATSDDPQQQAAAALIKSGQDNQQWLFVVQRSHDLEGMGEIREKMKVLCIPYRIKALSELRDPANNAAQLPYSVMLIDETFLSKLLKDKDKSKFKFLRGMPLKWVVISDPKKLSSSTDIKVLYGIDAESISGKASMPELFDCIQVVTHKLPPRTSPDALSAFDDIDELDSLRYRSLSNNSIPSYGIPYRKGARGTDRSDAEAVKRWLFLVRQFKAVASKAHSAESVLLNGLDARMKDIEDLRDVTDNLEGLLAVPGYTGPLADMNSHKKKAKYIVDTYQPLLAKLNSKFEAFDLIALQNLAATCAVQSSTLGLLRLSCWFTTLQEIVSITVNIMDTKDYLRGPDGADKSVSISFTSVGKALASRSTNNNTQQKYALEEAKSAAVAAPAKEEGIAAVGAGEKYSDLMALEDVSGGSEQGNAFASPSQPPRAREAPREASARAGAFAGIGAGASSAVPVALEGGQIPQQAKMIDAGLRTIIGDMVRAIEVAVWDAAMER